MLCIHNTQTDPYFNLAAEEYLLKNFKENIFMLWQNEPSIVIGKHQDMGRGKSQIRTRPTNQDSTQVFRWWCRLP